MPWEYVWVSLMDTWQRAESLRTFQSSKPSKISQQQAKHSTTMEKHNHYRKTSWLNTDPQQAKYMLIAVSFQIPGWLDSIIVANSKEKARQAASKHQKTACDPETLGSESIWQFETLKNRTGRSLEARAIARLEPWCQGRVLLTLYPWSSPSPDLHLSSIKVICAFG